MRTTYKTLVVSNLRRLAAIALACQITGAPLFGATDSFTATRDRAVNLYRTGHQEEAINLYRELATLEPQNVDVLHDLMWALWRAERYDEAGEVASRIHVFRPSDTEANEILSKAKPFSLRAKAVAAYRANRFDEATDLYKQLAALDPTNASVQKDLMWSMWGAGHYVEAGDVAKRLIALDPKDPEAWNMLGRTQMTAGQEQEALKSFQTSISFKPDQPNTQRAIGKILVDMREFSQAIKLFEDVRAKYADTPQLYPNLAKAQFYEGLFAESAKNWAKAVEYFPDHLTYRIHEAQALYYGGDVPGGLEKLRKIAAETHSWQAIDFLVDDALATKDVNTAANILESNLTELRPEDEPRLLRLAMIYEDAHEDKKALAVIDRFLNVNPKNVPALLFKADYLESLKHPTESAAYYQKVLLLNPYCLRAYAGLAETAMVLHQFSVALRYVQEVRQQDPTNPYWIILQAHVLYESGNYKDARALLLDWLKKNPGPSLPILLYHGLTPFKRDPLLAYSVHMGVSTFDDQMHAIKDAGYTPVTTEQVARWYEHKEELPPKPILITFDDARLDSFRYGDPILKKYGLKATMMAALVNVEGSLPPAFSPWEHMKEYAATGRWEIESHGDIAHIHIQIDPEGRQGLFLVNRQWLEREQRYETLAEWRDRIEADHESARDKIRDHLGYVPSGYAFPEGTYGQTDIVNSPEAVPINLAAVRKYYKVAFYQDQYGMNVRTKDPALLARIEPQKTWSGRELIERLQDRNPYTLIYRMLLAEAVWAGHTHEAYRWLSELKKEGASQPVLLAEEGRVRSYSGDLSHAEELAQRAIQMNPDPELQKIGSSIESALRPQWTPNATYQNDSRGRTDWLFRQSLDFWTPGDLRWSLLQNYGFYKERDAPKISDTSAGVGLARNFALFHSVKLEVLQHWLTGGTARDDVSAIGTLDSKWSDFFGTEFSAGRTLYDTASALSANITERYGSVLFNLGNEAFQLVPKARFSSLSDGNNRFTGEVEASHYLDSRLTFKMLYEFTYDNMHEVRPEYYSPQHLRQHELGFEYAPHFTHLDPFIRYLPGVGEEHGIKSGFIQDVEVGFPFKWGGQDGDAATTSFGPYYSRSQTPTYRRDTYSVIFSHRF